MADVERIPPCSAEAERCVLGSMLRDNGSIADILLRIGLDDLYYDRHRKVFVAIKDVHEKAGSVDLVMLAEELASRKQIEEVGGYGYLASLWDAAPTAANAEYYAGIVRDKAIVRSVIYVGGAIAKTGWDNNLPPEEMLEFAEREVTRLAGRSSTSEP